MFSTPMSIPKIEMFSTPMSIPKIEMFSTPMSIPKIEMFSTPMQYLNRNVQYNDVNTKDKCSVHRCQYLR